MTDHHDSRRGPSPAQGAILAVLLSLAALLFAVRAELPWPPAARADMPALQRVTLFDMPVTSGANVMTSSLSLARGSSHPAVAWRVTVLIKPGATDAAIKPVVTAGGVSFAGALNSATDLTAGSWYTFTFGPSNATTTATSQDLTWNVQFGASTTVAYLDLQEVLIP